jgi:hypothetical protein
MLRAGMRYQRSRLAREAVIALENRPLGQFRGAVLEAVTSDVRPAAEIVYQIVADCEHRITDLPDLPDLLSTTLR